MARYSRRFKSKIFYSLSIALILNSLVVKSAEEFPAYSESSQNEPDKSSVASFNENDLFGERYEPSIGRISFTQTDIDIPGNSHLPVRLRRIHHPILLEATTQRIPNEISGDNFEYRQFPLTYIQERNNSFSNWALDIPHFKNISSDVGYNFSENCNLNNTDTTSYIFTPVEDEIYNPYSDEIEEYFETRNTSHSSLTVFVNGSALRLRHLAPENRSLYPAGTQFVTDGHWAAKCVTSSGGFSLEMKSPNGDTYIFNETSDENKSTRAGYGGHYYASQVTDKFGNWVRYENIFEESGRIYSSDGREIKIFRDPNNSYRITRAEANGEVWYYHYDKYSLINTASVVTQELDPANYNSTNEMDLADIYYYDDIKVPYLSKVIRPDKKSYTFEYDYGNVGQYYYPEFYFLENLNAAENLSKGFIGLEPDNYFNEDIKLKFTHPEGAEAVYELTSNLACRLRIFSKSDFNMLQSGHGMGELCFAEKTTGSITGSSDTFDIYMGAKGYVDDIYTTYAQLKRKTIINSGDSAVWEYSYEDNLKNDLESVAYDSLDNHRTKTFIDHNQTRTTYEFNRHYAENAIHSIEVSRIPDGHVLSKKVFDYDIIENKNLLCPLQHNGLGATYRDICVDGELISSPFPAFSSWIDHNQRFIKKESITLDGSTYVKEIIERDAYNRVTKTKEYNNYSNKLRFLETGYHDVVNSSLYHLGQLDTTNISSDGVTWVAQEELEYDDNGNLQKVFNFDQLAYGISSRHTNGLPKRVYWGDTSKYEQYDNYYRGEARKITRPCSIVNGCDSTNESSSNTIVSLLEVNSDGRISSITDFNGNKTIYDFNSIGWLTNINYVDSKWADKTIEFATVTTDEDSIPYSGIEKGMLRKTEMQGDYEKRTYYDNLLQEVYKIERDISDSSTTRYQRNGYDSQGRKIFESFVTDDARADVGIMNSYDEIGRLTNILRQSDYSNTYIEYLSGNRKQITDPEGNISVTSFLAYGEPVNRYPTKISTPDTEDLDLEYNIHDQIIRISQGDISETRIYDQHQQLCKRVRPETGITAFSYNALGQLEWVAQGAGGVKTECDSEAVSSGHKVMYEYDNLGRLLYEDFPDDTPTNSYSYDNNGNLIGLESGDVSWTYEYNTLDKIESELLFIGVLEKVFQLEWSYNELGDVSSVCSGIVILAT